MTTVPLEVRLHSTLASARPAWSAVQPRTIFSTWEYLHSWWSVFGRGTLLCVEGIRNGAVQIVAPLFADQGMVYFIGSGGSDYLDFLGDAGDPEALESVLRLAMNSTPDFCGFCFYHVPDHSPTGRILQTISPALGLTPCVHYSLPAPVLTFASALSPPARKKSLIRHENRMRRSGELSVEHLRTTHEILLSLDIFFDQHDARSRQTGREIFFADIRQRRFYRELAAALPPNVILTRVLFNGQPAAFHFGFCYRGSFLWYKPCFSPALANYSPGEVLLRSLLQSTEDWGIHEFDFGLGEDAYKSRFATSVASVTSWGMYPAGATQ